MRQTRNPYIPFSTTCLHSTLNRKRVASDCTNFCICFRLMHGMKNEAPGWNSLHSTTTGRLCIFVIAGVSDQYVLVEEVQLGRVEPEAPDC